VKIGIFDPYLDDLGGGEKYMMTIAQCLSRRHEVFVFWDNYKDVEVLLERFSLDLSGVCFTKNIFTPGVPFLERVLKTRSYDVIILLSDGSIPFVLSKKLFLHFQQPMQHVSVHSFKSKLKFRRVNGIFCNSQFTKSFIDRAFHTIAHVIYPPIELHSKKVAKENIILHVGRFRVKNVGIGDYKKQSVMIDAFKKMVDNGLTYWKFTLAVSVQEKDVHEFEKLKKVAQGYPIEFVLNKSNEDLWNIYSRSKIYWHASGFGEDLITHPEYAEHFGISTVEAMGAGCVPVVIDAGGQAEIVENEKNGFLWKTLKDLQTKTKILMEDEKLWKDMSLRAVERAELFNNQRFCSEVSHIIQQ